MKVAFPFVGGWVLLPIHSFQSTAHEIFIQIIPCVRHFCPHLRTQFLCELALYRSPLLLLATMLNLFLLPLK
jgi:hypothetical protein